MIDIDYLSAHAAEAERKVAERGFPKNLVSDVLGLDEKRRRSLSAVEKLRAGRRRAASERNVELGKKLKIQLEKSEAKLQEIQAKYEEKLLQLPNLALPDVPVGSASKSKVIKESSEPNKFSFKPKDHLELGERLGIIDTQTAAKVSGARFAYLKGEAARLELALVNFAWENLLKAGFTPVMPPDLIRQEITEKLGYWGAGGNENYYLVSDPTGDAERSGNLYLIGTGEHALVPMHMGDVIPSSELPKRYVTFTPCFRREAGSYGKDTRGIIRVHQFEKVEMVSFVRPADGAKEFDLLLGSSWRMMEELGLPIRQVVLSSEDISLPAAKTVDIETWFPSQNQYRETHSISTTTDFQARRLNTKLIQGGKTSFVHILNGTAFAIGRTIAAILENYQREDGSVEIPKALRKFTGFGEIRTR
jgi:seryl-tRNA synthetase